MCFVRKRAAMILCARGAHAKRMFTALSLSLAGLSLALFLAPRASESALTLHLLPEAVETHHARCLDGSPFGFYLEEGVGEDKDKWVILLQGGGLCITPFDCYKRLSGGEGSSKHWGKTYTSNVDLMSSNATVNPFATWTRVWLRYCSGDTWTGQREDKVPYDLYFAGHHNLRAALDALLDPARGWGLQKATTLLFSGKSAGGIGVFSSSDWVRGKISKDTHMLSVPQAGYFFPASVNAYEEWMAGVDEPINKFFGVFWRVRGVIGGLIPPPKMRGSANPRRRRTRRVLGCTYCAQLYSSSDIHGGKPVGPAYD
jgi:Pectinacetylesterase